MPPAAGTFQRMLILVNMRHFPRTSLLQRPQLLPQRHNLRLQFLLLRRSLRRIITAVCAVSSLATRARLLLFSSAKSFSIFFIIVSCCCLTRLFAFSVANSACNDADCAPTTPTAPVPVPPRRPSASPPAAPPAAQSSIFCCSLPTTQSVHRWPSVVVRNFRAKLWTLIVWFPSSSFPSHTRHRCCALVARFARCRVNRRSRS